MKKQTKAPTNGKSLAAPAASAAVSMPQTGSAFSASTVELARRMRFNPLRMVSPENLAAAHDHFDLGYLWQGALFWDAMIRRDDTLSFVVPQLQNAVAQKPWGVQKRKDADPIEAARHAAALQYFYDNVTAVDAFDKNIRGDRHLLLKQMGLAHAMRYAVHHFVWKPSGKTIEVEGGAPVPALSAEMEYVPLWFFENTSGTLRLLRHGGYGGIGEDCNWEGEWMVTSGEGMMFAAAGCYIFKRLTFQDWTIYNERYGQQKVIGMTTARADSDAGRALTSIVQDFNGDMGIALHECQSTDKPPISLLGPEGTASVDVFERFLDRQDEKMTVMFRGGGQANIASQQNEQGISSQINECEALEMAHCANIASACRTFIDRAVIRYCFGEGVEPLAWFGLPDMDNEDAQQLRDSAGFIADRGGRVDLENVADRLGVPMLDETADEDDVLQPVGAHVVPPSGGTSSPIPPKGGTTDSTANTARLSRLQQLVEEALRTANYDPNEARDADGKWTNGQHAMHKGKPHTIVEADGDDVLIHGWLDGKRKMVKAGELTHPPVVAPKPKREGVNWLTKPFATKKEAEQFAAEKPGTWVEESIVDGKPAGWNVKHAPDHVPAVGHEFHGNQYSTGGVPWTKRQIHSHKMGELLQSAGVHVRDADVYGSQAVITTASREHADKAAMLLNKTGVYKVRGIVETTEDAKVNQGTNLLPTQVKIWRVHAHIPQRRADEAATQHKP